MITRVVNLARNYSLYASQCHDETEMSTDRQSSHASPRQAGFRHAGAVEIVEAPHLEIQISILAIHAC